MVSWSLHQIRPVQVTVSETLLETICEHTVIHGKLALHHHSCFLDALSGSTLLCEQVAPGCLPTLTGPALLILSELEHVEQLVHLDDQSHMWIVISCAEGGCGNHDSLKSLYPSTYYRHSSVLHQSSWLYCPVKTVQTSHGNSGNSAVGRS